MSPATGPQPPRLLDQLRQCAQTHFGRPEPGERYAQWATRFILLHHKRHPRDLGADDVGRFLDPVGQQDNRPVDSLFAAREALVFLYQNLLGTELGEIALPQPTRLLERFRLALRVRHDSPATEKCYLSWAERYLRFHRLRHPRDMGAAEVNLFLTDLAVNGHVSAGTQNQALNALVFL